MVSNREEVRLRVMQLIEKNPEITQRELSRRLNVSLGSVNFCIRALIERGLVKMGNFYRNRDKSSYVYILTPSGVAEKAEITRKFLKKKRQEFYNLKTEIESLESELSKSTDFNG